jgi:3-methyladenine DNA glycosylase Mpg
MSIVQSVRFAREHCCCSVHERNGITDLVYGASGLGYSYEMHGVNDVSVTHLLVLAQCANRGCLVEWTASDE